MNLFSRFLALFSRRPSSKGDTPTLVLAVPAVPASAQTPSRKKATPLTAIVGAGAASILVSFVPSFEGMILRGYKDPIGIVTACGGHTRTAVLGRAYTIEECNALLDQDLAEHAKGTMAVITVPTSVGERAAYVSFTYNVGVGAFRSSTLLKKLNAGDHIGACNELLRWTKAGGRELKGLVRRRKAEQALCLQPGQRS